MDAVVVTYNSAHEIARLLSDERLFDAFDRVIVVDNGSADATLDIAHDGGAIVLDRGVNGGFAVGVNVGARATHGDRFAVLNPDIGSLTPEVTRRLEAHLDHPAVGVVAPALERPDGELQDSAREVPSPLDLARRRFWKQVPDEVRSARPVIVDWVVAACLAIRRDAFEAVGGFDERYFLYFEDVDFGVRMRRAGYGVVYDPTLRVRHEHAAESHASLASWATRQHLRSAYTFYSRNSGYLWPRRLRPPGRAAIVR
jgi:N-acetylglucosaminyl-diphospho-decaprenol L-rhamnosyltransferase